MNDLNEFYFNKNGLSLQECIYKIRDWANIVTDKEKKKDIPLVSFSEKLIILASFVDNLFIDSNASSSNHTCMSIMINILHLLSTLLDVFSRAGRHSIAFIRHENWCERFGKLVKLVCEQNSSRSSDIQVVLKQLRILKSRMIFSNSDVEAWMTACGDLLELQKASSKRPAGVEPACNACPDQKKRKETRHGEIVALCLKAGSAGGLAVYRVCFLIEVLANRMNLPLVVQQLAQEIFHTFVISSRQVITAGHWSECPQLHTKSYSLHCMKDSDSDKREAPKALQFISHYSAVPSEAAQDFWTYSNNINDGRSHFSNVYDNNIGEWKCEESFSAAAVAGILLATKVMKDINVTCAWSFPRLSVILNVLKTVLSSSDIRAVLYENQRNAFKYSTATLKEKIFHFEMKYLSQVQYDVTHWSGGVMSTLADIAALTPDTITPAMVEHAVSVWNTRVWWFTNISARATKVELGLAALIIGNEIHPDSNVSATGLDPDLVSRWCGIMTTSQSVVQALVEEMRQLSKDVGPAICQQFRIDTAKPENISSVSVK